MYKVNYFFMKTVIRFIFISAVIFQTVSGSDIAFTKQSNSAALKFIGHAFVKISTTSGKIIYVDPFNENEFADSADVVLITHEHSDHNDLSRIRQKASCQVIRSANALQGDVYQNFVIGNIKIQAVPAYNTNHSKSACVGYVVEFDSIKIYHAGDTGKIPEMADLASQNIDYALLPTDGIYTMTPEEATEAAALIQAKHDIPIHTMPPPDTYSTEIVDRFTSPNKLVVTHGETIELKHTTTSIKEFTKIVDGFSLSQNFPNPFNPKTVIRYTVGAQNFVPLQHVDLSIYNTLGQKIYTLVSEKQKAGFHQVEWDGTNNQNQIVPSGIYVYKLQSTLFNASKKMVLMR